MSSSLFTVAHALERCLLQTASLARSKKSAKAATTATASAGTWSRVAGAAWVIAFSPCILSGPVGVQLGRSVALGAFVSRCVGVGSEVWWSERNPQGV